MDSVKITDEAVALHKVKAVAGQRCVSFSLLVNKFVFHSFWIVPTMNHAAC